jgi:hypothetical protein
MIWITLSVLIISSIASAQTQVPAAPKAPVVKPPTVPSAGAGAAIAAPSGNASDSAKVVAPAPYVTTRFDEASYKQISDSGSPILLIFSHASDSVWQRQGPVIQSILKEPEFGKIAVFQIDIGAYPAIAQRFLVSSPGTLLVMKGGFERLRSTRMTKPDVIRKMLRLHSAL